MVMAAGSDAKEFEIPKDVTPVTKLALRDGAIALAALSLWAAADTWQASSALALASFVSVLDGFFVGALLAALAHEWGHFAGARLAGGIAPTRGFSSVFPIFLLDMERSDPRAFRAMSVGGNLAHWLVVIGLASFVPLDAPGRIALVSAAFGFACFASITELPIIRRAFSGIDPSACFKGLTGAKLRRNQRIGALAGLVLFALL